MVSEIVTLEGHIIDSGLLTHVLDDIVSFGGDFQILEVHVGRTRSARSHARIEVRAAERGLLDEVLEVVARRGALWQTEADVELAASAADGVLPDGFYVSTNQQTLVRHAGEWHEVQRQEMDCAIVQAGDAFRCVPMRGVRAGEAVVCGERGIKVVPFERQHASGLFEFMRSEVSTEKPKGTVIRSCAQQMVAARRAEGKLLLVGGPALVHTGAVQHVVRLIERGYVDVLFAGNGLAVYDIEYSMCGTSMGVYIDKATLSDGGHMHPLRALNAVRKAGSVANAVSSGVVTSGIMHACVTHGVQTVLAGSIRDDGPIPDVITDSLEAQDRMRAALTDVRFALMTASGLHSIATCNLLPAWIPVVCVDILPAVLTSISDRGSFQTVRVVTDVEPFLRALVDEIDALESD